MTDEPEGSDRIPDRSDTPLFDRLQSDHVQADSSVSELLETLHSQSRDAKTPSALLRMLADRPLARDQQDRLDFKPFADALADLLDDRGTDTPLTIAISGEWGTGKTSLARMIEYRLTEWAREKRDPPHIICWFNAWMHDDAPHLGAAFAADVAKTANNHRARWRRITNPLPTSMLSPQERWRRHIRIGALALLLAALVVLSSHDGRTLQPLLQPRLGFLQLVQEGFYRIQSSFIILVWLMLAIWGKLFSAAQEAARFIDDPRSEAAKGSMQQVRQQLGVLIHQALSQQVQLRRRSSSPRRLVIFVDDLERCKPPRAVEVCEVASQLLSHPNVITVLVADMIAVATSAAVKYSALEVPGLSKPEAALSELDLSGYGRRYLQKIVQLQFNLPPMKTNDMYGVLSDAVVKLEPQPAPVETGRTGSHWTIGRWSIGLAGLSLAVVLFLVSPWAGVVASIVISVAATVDLQSIEGIPSPTDLKDYFRRVFRSYRSRNRAGEQDRIDQVIREGVAEGELDVDRLVQRVEDSGVSGASKRLDVRQQAQRVATDEKIIQVLTESKLWEFVAPIPRSAKRLLNQLRILFIIADKRQLFKSPPLSESPSLDHEHIVKWAILLEYIPELSEALARDPSIMVRLEQALTVDEMVAAMPRMSSREPSMLNNCRRLLKMRPELAPVTTRLIYLR